MRKGAADGGKRYHLDSRTMHSTPQPPARVPPNARYDAALGGWEMVQTDAAGRRVGEALVYREDGSVRARFRYRDDVLDGPFALFHPNGQLAREGSYSLGKVHGEVVAYRSDAPTPLALRGCCVPAAAWPLRSSYRDGRLLREVFYDREGRPMTSDGTLWPERPASVAKEADFDEYSGRWKLRIEQGGGVHVDRFYDQGGVRVEEKEYRTGLRFAGYVGPWGSTESTCRMRWRRAPISWRPSTLRCNDAFAPETRS